MAHAKASAVAGLEVQIALVEKQAKGLLKLVPRLGNHDGRDEREKRAVP